MKLNESQFFSVALWTMKVMEHSPDDHLLFFFCIDYTVWPGKSELRGEEPEPEPKPYHVAH